MSSWTDRPSIDSSRRHDLRTVEAPESSCSAACCFEFAAVQTRGLTGGRESTCSDLYDDVRKELLDVVLPARQHACRPRPSDACYASSCRRLQSCIAAAAVAVRDACIFGYAGRRHQKAQFFWRARIDSGRSNPQRLWRSVDALLSRGRLAATSSVSVEEFCSFFTKKG
jgi:hypothetical protein